MLQIGGGLGIKSLVRFIHVLVHYNRGYMHICNWFAVFVH